MTSHLTIMSAESDPLVDTLVAPLLKPLHNRVADPLRALGALCGIDGLAMNAEGYCCLMLDHHQVVHLARRPGSTRIILSVSLTENAGAAGCAGPSPLAGADKMSTWCASGIRLKALSDGGFCAQRIFEGQDASGEALLAAMDHLLAYAEEWDDAVAAEMAVSTVSAMSDASNATFAGLPFSRVIDSGFSCSVKRRSRCA